MKIDKNKNYFLMSYRFDKCKPEEFNLIPLKSNLFLFEEDKSIWVNVELYDFGWGKEYGFMRLPKLKFEELWYLLTESKIQDNKYGAASIIEDNYSRELMKYIINFLENTNEKIIKSFKEAFKILKLDEIRNRSKTSGKTYNQIQMDFEKWKYISKKVSKYIK